MIKKALLILIFCLLANLAQAAPDTAAHFSEEANFRLRTLTAWNKSVVKKTKVGRNSAWLIQFCLAGQSIPDPCFGLKVVNGDKDENIQQTCLDFASGAASLLLLQLAEAERENPSVEGFALAGSEVKKYGRYEYIILKLYNPAEQTVIYRAMTAADNCLYSFNYKIAGNAGWPYNLEVMLSSLEPV